MRIVEIRERAVAISRYDDPAIPSGGLDTSIVAVVTNGMRDGRPVVGYGFASVGRFAQGGLIRERFAPRLLAAPEIGVDPIRAWDVMMKGEKPGGHGERCVAVGTLDMALWDAAAKLEDVPLSRLLAERLGRTAETSIPVYAGGGYYYPANDRAWLEDELRRMVDAGYTRAKLKIGGASPAEDLRRIEAAAKILPAAALAVDAMNAYDAVSAPAMAAALAPYGLAWFEDICDPLDFETHAAVARAYPAPIAAGEALFSVTEALALDRYGGLRKDRDVLVFDPVHCYGIPGYLRIVDALEARGWPRHAFWPHGGHPFCLHVVSALGLGGAEVNPFSFAPFGGLVGPAAIAGGRVAPPDAPGIGFELKPALRALFASLLA